MSAPEDPITYGVAGHEVTPPAAGPRFDKGDRVYHGRRGWATFLLHDRWDADTAEVLFDEDGDAARITTAWLSSTGPGGSAAPPVPDNVRAQYDTYGL